MIDAFDKNKSLFDPDRITLEEREKLRSSFISDFSIDKIQNMKLDEYVAGKHDPRSNEVDKTTFCYRLERGSPPRPGLTRSIERWQSVPFFHHFASLHRLHLYASDFFLGYLGIALDT